MTKGIAGVAPALSACLFIAACSDQAPVDRVGTDMPAPTMQIEMVPVTQAEVAGMRVEAATVLPNGVEGLVRGQPFKADQAKIENGILTIREGREFFADRSVVIFTFKKNLDNETFVVGNDANFGSPHIHLGIRKPGKDLPDQSFVMDGYSMTLEFGERDALGLPFTIQLDAEHNGEPTRVAGRYIATFGDLRIRDGRIDVTHDSLDTLGYVAKQYLADRYPDATWHNRFGVSYTSYGDASHPKRGFVGFERDTGDNAPAVAKIHLYKDASGWAVVNELEADRLNVAHPVGEWPDGHERSTQKLRARTAAVLRLENELIAEGVMNDVRGTMETCYLAGAHDKASCRIMYGLREAGDKACLTRNYLLKRNGDDWRVVRRIEDTQKIDHAGALTTYKPFSTVCS